MGHGAGCWLCGAGLAACVGVLSAFQNFRKPWREYPAFEYNDFPIPPDYQEKTEWVFARLMYPNMAFVAGAGAAGSGAASATGARADAARSWTMDYPRSDRHFSAGPAAADAHPRALRGAAHQPG